MHPRGVVPGAVLMLAGALMVTSPVVAAGGTRPTASGDSAAAGDSADATQTAAGLARFKAWLDHTYPGYGCDEGPARFANAKVAAAYPGERFYYVLTYTRGIRPPYANSLSRVVRIGGGGEGGAGAAGGGGIGVLDAASIGSFSPGLVRVTSAPLARRAAAAVLVLAFGDPGERRWRFDENLVEIAKSRKRWLCSYRHDDYHISQVEFDRSGTLVAIRGNAPPVP